MTERNQRRIGRSRGRAFRRILAYAGLLVATYATAVGAAWWRYATVAGAYRQNGYDGFAGVRLGVVVLLAGTAIGGYLLASRWWLAVAPLSALVVGGVVGILFAADPSVRADAFALLLIVLVVLVFSAAAASVMALCGWIGITLRARRRARLDR